MVSSSRVEIWSWVRGQKLTWLYFEQQRMQRWKSGLATPCSFLIGLMFDRKGTLRTTGSSLPIVHIDGAVWYIAVGSSYPGRAEASKGVGVHALKGIVSWVKNVARQFVWYLLGVLLSEWNELVVREEPGSDASGEQLSFMAGCITTRCMDKSWMHLSSKLSVKRLN